MRPHFHHKGRPVKDRAFLKLFCTQVPYCQCCGRKAGARCWWAGRVALHVHHVVKGRSDEPANVLRLCLMCHGLAHGLTVRDPSTGVALPGLQELALQLGLKAARDPERHDPGRLRELLGRPVPEPAPVPRYFDDLWTLHRGKT